MNRPLSRLVLLCLISRSISVKLNCTDKVDKEINGVPKKCLNNPCPKDNSTRNWDNVQLKDLIDDPHFDQMLRLRIIGGACVTQGEVTEAYVKLIYIYSCIFPLINDKSTKDLEADTSITLGQLVELDNRMQVQGRVFLHTREEKDPELIKRKIDDFIKHLLHRNEYKQYRRYPKPELVTQSRNRKKTKV